MHPRRPGNRFVNISFERSPVEGPLSRRYRSRSIRHGQTACRIRADIHRLSWHSCGWRDWNPFGPHSFSRTSKFRRPSVSAQSRLRPTKSGLVKHKSLSAGSAHVALDHVGARKQARRRQRGHSISRVVMRVYLNTARMNVDGGGAIANVSSAQFYRYADRRRSRRHSPE